MEFVTPAEVAAVMNLAPIPRSLAELEARVRDGLPKSALAMSVQHIATDAETRRALRASVVPEATYKRRRERLSMGESEKTERIARIYATASYVWGDPGDARTFLAAAHPLLEGRRPLDVALTELGARRVEALLSQILYGLPA
ncbi:antitoxin Xre/MbcA/ParS toxin-binding domain-containing protein [Paraburkholderia sp.]|uniref:Antitoxin Xre/MbcA/ParS toxin-binding domain-containing protein n=1 Tax=Paraburkholderia denitrificans TaxID=694025 RepID=A0ABW0JD50_9BURK|nr:antitoxin Xre/MbcA/ParS toxin-binding domain-containing protein [Paraburkholderia sp.]